MGNFVVMWGNWGRNECEWIGLLWDWGRESEWKVWFKVVRVDLMLGILLGLLDVEVESFYIFLDFVLIIINFESI